MNIHEGNGSSLILFFQLERKRSDYNTLLERHETHYNCVELMKQSLQ